MTTRAFELALLYPADPTNAAVGDSLMVTTIGPPLETEWAPVIGGGGGGIPEPPATGEPYLRANGAWTQTLDAGVY